MINSEFDGGNIEVVDAGDHRDIQLKIRADQNSPSLQWFYFRLTGARDLPVKMKIVNAAAASYLDGWADYEVCVSYDRIHWFRVPTRYEDGQLLIDHQPESDSVYYAYFAPYSLERHADLIASSLSCPGVEYQCPGLTVDGRMLDLLKISPTDSSAKLVCWITARQHCGETMAEWLLEGLLDRLLNPDDPVARKLRQKATFYVVPNMNPDGSFRGHLRGNALGIDLNREWESPDVSRSPEVFHVRKEMIKTGVDFYLDVHGDEGLPYTFIATCEDLPTWDQRLDSLLQTYSNALLEACPEFQTQYSHPLPPGEKPKLNMAHNWTCQQFNCLSMTMEQPFKDTANSPHPDGWSPERARLFGHAQLTALSAVIDQLR